MSTPSPSDLAAGIDPATLDAFTAALRRLGGRFTAIAAAHGAAHATLGKQDLLAIGVLGLEGAVRMGDLAERLGIRQSAVTPIIDRLEEAELVERQRSEADRRVWLAALTEAGTQVYDQEDVIYRQTAAEMLAPLDANERATLVRLLAKMSVSVGGV
ncbi:MAG: MarR family transcriptional regulator [Bacteroidota bacterium]